MLLSPGSLERSFRSLNRSPNRFVWRVSENGRVIVFEEYEIKTGGRLDTVDVTQDVQDMVRRSGIGDGSVLVFSPHTTCCVMIAARDVGTSARLADVMESLAPSNGYYAHDDLSIRTENLIEHEPANAPAHLYNVFAGKTSECIPVAGGSVVLGHNQRVLFVELDSSRKRRYFVQVVGR
jgi:secondary thiamine-phosphate synthase enzyme